MTTALISPDVREFVLKYVRSVAYLEGLMLLSRAPDRSWDSAALRNRLYISADEAGVILNLLCHDGLATENDGLYRFSCPSAELAAIVAQLDKLYRNALIPLTQLIHANRPSRVQEFANAFKLRKEK